MKAQDIINKYINFFKERGHKQISNAPLVPENDPTTLFTSSGMQPLVPYLLGETHPMGKRLVNVQNCFRAQDIDEVGDNRHTTFFRMLGNWSLENDYFKNEEIPWLWEFLTDKNQGLGLDPNRLYVTVYDGDDRFKVKVNSKLFPLEADLESVSIWNKIFKKENIDFIKSGKISSYSRLTNYKDKNWWSRAGTPEKMPIGEPGGPDTEVFYDFGENLKIHENSIYKGQKCHPNCDCGRFLEIGNSVFMQYKKIDDTTFEELPNKNVDFGGGLERLNAATNNNPDIFQTDLYQPIINRIINSYHGGIIDPEFNWKPEKYPLKPSKAPIYEQSEEKKLRENVIKSVRIIADHLKAATFIILSGVIPSNKERGYVLRRLLRRAAVKMHKLGGGLTSGSLTTICDDVLRVEESIDPLVDRQKNRENVMKIVDEEMEKFGNSLDKGLKIFEKYEASQLNELNAFNLFQSYGFPFEISEELFGQKGKKLDREKFNEAMKAHRELSRTASSGMFKGGLADTSERTIMGHTATHLLHKALRDMLGTQLHQTGSNITAERVRFDFNFDRNLTTEEIKKIENTINEKIKENLPVHFEMLSLAKAKETGAIGLFDEKYSDNVKVYFVGPSAGSGQEAYSKEFCGGPHVTFTSLIKSFKIIKQENIGKGNRRIYAKVG